MNGIKIVILTVAIVLAALSSEATPVASPAKKSAPGLRSRSSKQATAKQNEREVCLEQAQRNCYSVASKGRSVTLLRKTPKGVKTWSLEGKKASNARSLFEQISTRAAQASRNVASAPSAPPAACPGRVSVQDAGRTFTFCPTASGPVSRDWMMKWFSDLHALTVTRP